MDGGEGTRLLSVLAGEAAGGAIITHISDSSDLPFLMASEGCCRPGSERGRGCMRFLSVRLKALEAVSWEFVRMASAATLRGRRSPLRSPAPLGKPRTKPTAPCAKRGHRPDVNRK